MIADVRDLWWNPWAETGLETGDVKTVVCIDRMSPDPSADCNIILLAEPESVCMEVNSQTLENHKSFDKIYTHNQTILDKCGNSEFFPWGTCWLNFNDFNPVKKPQISVVASSKQFTEGHKTRHRAFDVLSKMTTVNGMEIIKHKSPPWHGRRNDFFENTMFNVCVENSRQRNYFTEKVIDCFASKTIPIYWGCSNIGDWFNMDGVITFETIPELQDILSRIGPDLYAERQKAVEDNHEIAKNFHGTNDVVPRLTQKITEYIKIRFDK